MKKLLGAVVLLVLVVTSVWSQPALRIMTRPKVPSRDVLERLNLALAWQTRLATGGQRDGLFTLQLIPARIRMQLVVQTISGTVYMLDAETGDPLWHTSVGIPGWGGQPVGYNGQSLFVIRRDIVYVLNRATGAQRYYTLDRDTKLPTYGFTLPGAPSAAPQADEDMIFFCMGNRVEAFLLPIWDSAEGSLKRFGEKELSAPELKALADKTATLPPFPVWSYQEAGMNVEQPVLITPENVTAVSTAGTVMFFKKTERAQPYEFQTHGTVAAPMGRHGLMAYVGSEDYTLYAFNMANQRLDWRFLASAPILVKPEVTDRDIFVAGHRLGLYRVERGTGRAAWLNKQADRFLSTNQKYVYALDPTGMLLVIDYARGTTLGQYDMRDWIIPVPNELTDRFYLASHDGQIICLRNRAEKAPLRIKTFDFGLLKLPKKEEKKEMKGEPEVKDKEEGKDKAKDEDKAKDKDQDKEKQKDQEKKKDEEGALLNGQNPHGAVSSFWARWEAKLPRKQYVVTAWNSSARMRP
jgi:hypothetical protein